MRGDERGQPRLLAIDDSQWIHRLLRVRLGDEAIEIHNALTGRQGLDAARALRPDVILLDLDLPDISGFQILETLKADADMRDTPVLVLSTATNTHSKVRAFDLGAFDFIDKPFIIAELRVRIRSAVRLRKLIMMLAQRAQIDGLTGLWNRSYFDQRLREEIARAVRHGTDLSLVLCDLDRFKGINDKHGHPFGDRVLEAFAGRLKRGRVTDVACRYGGEEFALILPNTNAEEAATVADRLRQVVADLSWGSDASIRVTCSFGVTDLRRVGASSAETMIVAADQALYAAKGAGRNCVRVARPQPRSNRDSA